VHSVSIYSITFALRHTCADELGRRQRRPVRCRLCQPPAASIQQEEKQCGGGCLVGGLVAGWSSGPRRPNAQLIQLLCDLVIWEGAQAILLCCSGCQKKKKA
jgi:hypothetical protein